MKSCPLCSSEIAGRNATEVEQEYREMVAKAQAAQALEEAAQHALDQLTLGQPDSHRDLEWELRWLAERVREAAGELRPALREYREAIPRRRW